MSKLAPTAFVALSLLAAGTASADSKSWNAVKGSIHAKATIVFGGNLDAVRGTKIYGTALPMLTDEDPDIKAGLAVIKDTCQIDVPAAISDFTVIMKRDQKPLVVLGLSGLDEARVLSCLEAVALQKTGQAVKLTGKRKGKVTVYSVPGEREKVHAAWLAKDVIAFTDDPTSASKLSGMLAGKAPKGQLAKDLAKIDTSAALWAAVAMKEKEDGVTIIGGRGDVKVAGGKFNGAAHIALSNATEAQKVLTMAQQGLDELKQQAPAKSSIATFVGSIKLGVTANELDISAVMADADVMQIMQDFGRLF